VTELVENPRPISMMLFSAAMAALHSQATQNQARSQPSRQIPHLELSALNGCSEADKTLIARTLQGAIEVGAPLYNEGKLAACYQIYEGAAADITQRLPVACRGPKLALSEGRTRAAKLVEPSDQAWAMRDSFDGVLELLARAAH
jgi:serine protease Do